MRFIILLSAMLAFSYSSAQTNVQTELGVSLLMEKFESIGRSDSTVEGWRIKIINTTDRREMEKTSFKFRQLFPDKESESSYENPYYSIRTGAFKERIDLEPLIVEMKKHFRSAIPVRDKIEKVEIVGSLTHE